jgi:hypothetical protein
MSGTALLGRLTWQLAELVEVVAETPRVKTIVFDVAGWAGHRAGQHVERGAPELQRRPAVASIAFSQNGPPQLRLDDTANAVAALPPLSRLVRAKAGVR